ncbi:winged helix-turn-helix domain-containing protein [Acidianus brierleyi]|uniref:winged helix-turn-helix domain-containing protein n=1 Tax=Acidianus brierleyi TaxID=41673 RepID=UPI001FE459AE|nr:winged helix-turn-helix domain-containing protein [Acidianus brierleyi]
MDDLTKIIKDRTRREILLYLHNRGKATYSDILHDMKLSTGKLNYHLKVLEPFLSKENEYYKLNDKGNQLAEIILSLGDNKNSSEKYYRNSLLLFHLFSSL